MILLFPANNCKLNICQYNSRKFGLIKSKGSTFVNFAPSNAPKPISVTLAGIEMLELSAPESRNA